MRLRERAPIDFDLVAVNLDQGQPGFPAHVVEDHLRRWACPTACSRRDTYSVVKRVVPEGKSTCAACSRFRRGVLYDAAVELGCTKIALGHHRDDLIETLLLNALYSGSLKAMPPKLRSRDGRNVVIRPLCYAAEERHRRLRRGDGLPHRPLRPVRLAAQPPAQAGEGPARRALGRAPRGEGQPAQRARPRGALATCSTATSSARWPAPPARIRGSTPRTRRSAPEELLTLGKSPAATEGDGAAPIGPRALKRPPGHRRIAAR